MQVYKYTNTHPQGDKSLNDCVYRAISIATDKPWLQIYDELTALGRSILAPPNDSKTYKTYLDNIAEQLPAIVNKKRLTGKDLTKLDGVFIIQTAHHLAAVKNKQVLDTWDSSDKSAYRIWKLK